MIVIILYINRCIKHMEEKFMLIEPKRKRQNIANIKSFAYVCAFNIAMYYACKSMLYCVQI